MEWQKTAQAIYVLSLYRRQPLYLAKKFHFYMKREYKCQNEKTYSKAKMFQLQDRRFPAHLREVRQQLVDRAEGEGGL